MQATMTRWLVTLCIAGMAPAYAQTQTVPPAPFQMSGFVEAGMLYSRLSGNFEDWNDQYLRASLQVSPISRINGEVSHQDHFDDQGTFVGAGYTRIFSDTWHGSLSAGTSDGGRFLPRARIDASLHRKWLEKKNLVSSLALGYYKAKEIYYDRSLVASAIYYFDGPWIAEAGMRMNQSNPGNIRSERGFITLYQGRNKQHYLVLRHETGREGYQLVKTGGDIRDFSSNETSFTWRQWITPNAGINLVLDYYVNPYYHRSGIQAGVFMDF